MFPMRTFAVEGQIGKYCMLLSRAFAKYVRAYKNLGTVPNRAQGGNHWQSVKYSYMRIDYGYVKMTENERAYILFFNKINEIFALFRRKTLYSFFLCDIMDEVDGQANYRLRPILR